MKPIIALYVANAREFLRDRSAMFFVVLLPVAFAVFFGSVLGGSGSFTLQLGVANEDAGPAGANIVTGLESQEAQQVLRLHRGTRAEMLEALDKGEVSVAMVLPEDLSASLSADRPSTVDVFYDPAQSNSAGIGLGIARTLLGEANLAISGSPRLLVMQEQTTQTHPPRSIDFFLPGLLGMALLWLGLFGTAMPLVQLREGQVLRRLRVTSLAVRDLLAAQVAWRVTVGLLQTTIFLLVGYLGFQVGVAGNWLLLVGGVTLGALVFVVMGYVLAGLAASSEGVTALTQIANFSMMFLSGTFFPSEIMPASLQPVVAALPLTYLNDLLRQIMVSATPQHALWLDFAVLGGWLAVLMALAVKLWRWE